MPVDALPPALSPRIGLAAALVLDEFDGENHSALSNLGDMRVVFEFTRAAAEIDRLCSIALDSMVGRKNVERRQRGGTGERIAGVALVVGEGRRFVVAVGHT